MWGYKNNEINQKKPGITMLISDKKYALMQGVLPEKDDILYW